MRILAVLALALGVAAAGEEEPVPPEMDDRSRELLEAWEKKEYNLGRAGAEKASFKLSAHVRGRVDGHTAASYVWDGEKGTLDFEDPEIGGFLAQQGWNNRMFDPWFRGGAFRDDMRGTKLTAEERDDGTTVVAISGEEVGDVSELRFDASGVLVAVVSEARMEKGATVPVVIRLTYRKESGLYLLAGFTAEVRTPVDPYVEETTFEHRKVGVFVVPAKAESTATIGGKPAGSKRILFSDWKFNDDVGK